MIPDCGLTGVLLRESPNHGPRRGDAPTDMIVLHYTGMVDARSALDRLCDPAAEVSSHYLVEEDGTVTQMVPEARRAWHAGLSWWHGETDLNSRSIGIEIVNCGHEIGYQDFPENQINSVIDLCLDIDKRHAIPAERVLAHSDIAPGRKIDPGEKFPWARLAEAGIGHWVAPEPISGGRFFQEGDGGEPVSALQAMLALYGYRIDVSGSFDRETRNVVDAFQRHFRPARPDGIADRSTIETLRRLLAALGSAD